MGGKKANKAYKFRLYPSKEQQIIFAKTFGCVRFIYNRILADKKAYYEETGKRLQVTPAAYKSEFPWLKEVDSLALANAQLHLQTAYKNFFRDMSVGFPKFKSKKSGYRSYTTNNQNGTVRIEGSCIRIPKVGMVKVKLHRQIPDDQEIKSVTVSQEPTGKYFISILVEYAEDLPEVELNRSNSVGLDYSSPHFYVSSDGHVADMPHFYRNAERHLAKEQRKLSRMVKGSHSYRKQKIRVAKAHEHVRNCRKDYQHKESRRLADTYDYICLEDINLQSMARGLHLGKATNDNGFGAFRQMLIYKMQEQGKKVITIDKWFPSSKACHHCRYINSNLSLSDRAWTCPSCGEHLDRDINAAINILNEGLAKVS